MELKKPTNFMEVEWGKSVKRAGSVERLPNVFDFPVPETPDAGIEIPEDPSTLSDEDVLEMLHKVSTLHSSAEAAVGMYSAAEEYMASEYRETEVDVYKDLYPEGKPKGVTVDEARIEVESDERLRNINRRLVDIKVAQNCVRGFARSYSRLAMQYSQMLKYRHFTGDRPPQVSTYDGWED